MYKLLGLLFTLIFLSSCQTSLKHRFKTAENLAKLHSMDLRRIETNQFLLTYYERIHAFDRTTAIIYIEGDGRSWSTRHTPSSNPTPVNPIALKLATQDKRANVIYLARPCQYNKSRQLDGKCSQKYWTSHRFAPEIIEAMNTALSEIKLRYNITNFELIGFSGGGAIAALLAAQRNDVLNIRTVAGNLDHVVLHNIHNVSQLYGSMNAADIANNISHIPQHHFIGEKDKIVGITVYQSFNRLSGNTKCIRSTLVPNATHTNGWSEIWSELLESPLNCNIAK